MFYDMTHTHNIIIYNLTHDQADEVFKKMESLSFTFECQIVDDAAVRTGIFIRVADKDGKFSTKDLLHCSDEETIEWMKTDLKPEDVMKLSLTLLNRIRHK
jgi:hypothetical protein